MKSTAKLMNGEDVLKILSEQAPVGACVMQDGRFCYLNSFFSSATGYTADELAGKDSLEIVVPEDREMVRENTLRMLKGELLSPYQFRVTCKDNGIIWVMATVRSIQYRGRRATLGNYMEVTERRLMEQAVKESEEKYRELANSITDVFFAMDEHLRYTYWNRASEVLTGIRAEDAVGRSLCEIFPDKPWRRRAEEVYRSILRTQQSQTFVNDYDIDGRHYVLEINAYPSRGGVSVFVKDITEHKQAEDARREAEKEKSALLEEAPVSIVHTDLKGKIIYVNQRFESESGYPREEVIGRNGFQLDWFPAGTLEFLTERMAARLGGSPAKHWETQFKCKDGQWIWIELEGKILGRSGVPVGFQIIAANITERKQAEEALRQSEERYRTILEETGDGYFETDLAGNFTFVNDAQARLLTCSKKEIIGTSFRAFTPEERVNSVLEAYSRMYKTGEPLRNFVDEVIGKDGSHGFAETSAFPTRNDKGEIVGFRGVRRDITEHKQAEEALRRSEDRYRTILEEMEDSYFEVDLGGHFTFVNNSVCRNLGYSKEELIGMSYKKFTAEDDVESVFRVFNEVCQTDRPNKGFPWKVIRKEGIPGFAEASVSLLRDSKGEIIGFRGVGRDITERKQAEERLRQSEENYRTLFNSSVIGTIVLDAETMKVMMANQATARMFGFSSAEEIRGADPLEFIHPEDREEVLELATKSLFEQDSHQTRNLRAITKDGQEVWVSATGARIMHEGRLAGLISFADITEQKRQNERLMMTERLASIGELAAGAAHELNNPLTGIIGFSELLMEKDIPDYIREDLAMIRSEAQRAANVTSNLLTFARKHRPVKQLTRINDVIEDVLKLRAYAHKSNCIDVERDLASDLPEIPLDHFQMQQVFLNIVINAEYFITQAHKKGTLTVTTKRRNSSVLVSFADDGPGIAAENLGRIFDPFFTTKEAGKGTGLGLSICHGIVAEHGGQIYATSQPDKGAIIFVELPINGNNRVGVTL
jgi:two-component system NtrC family sensor kinase